MRIAFFGAGAWGTAMAIHAAARHDVLLWARDAFQAQAMSAERCNARYLPQARFPDRLAVSENLGETCSWLGGAQQALAVVATPVAGLRSTLLELRGALPQGLEGVLWLCKGLERETGAMPHQVAATAFPDIAHGVLSGPSFAQEVAEGLPVALTVASPAQWLRDAAQRAFHHEAARIYGSEDVIGVELGGALKNVMAIAAGIGDGMKLGHNARAALITRGLAEIARLGAALGARPETFTGLTGLGDLVLTCTGDLSRNRRVGLALAQGEGLADIVRRLGHVAEGVPCAEAAAALARQHRVEMPIVSGVQAVLAGHISPGEALRALLSREPRDEHPGGASGRDPGGPPGHGNPGASTDAARSATTDTRKQ